MHRVTSLAPLGERCVIATTRASQVHRAAHVWNQLAWHRQCARSRVVASLGMGRSDLHVEATCPILTREDFAMPLISELTTFSRDALGRYICNSFDEARVTSDPVARAAAGLPARGDLRPFDFIIIGGGTFGAALAEHLWFRSTFRGARILVLEGGPFMLPEHVQNLPVLGLNAGAARKDHAAQNEVWGLAWNSSDPIGFPGLAYCIGGRSVYWGGWSPRLLDSELPSAVWPKSVLGELNPKTLPDGCKGYFRQASTRSASARPTTSSSVTFTERCASNSSKAFRQSAVR
jgi:hypothetical protein